MESASSSNESFFYGCGEVKMSKGVLKKLQEIKELKKQQRPLQQSNFNNRNTDSSDKPLDDSLEQLCTTANEQQSPNKNGRYFSTDQDSNKENQSMINADGNLYDEEIENSFEKSSSPAINLDDIPVTNIVQGGKTFEQVIEEQLEMDQQLQQQMLPKVPASKKNFLRKGQGTARFNGPPPPGKVTRRKKSTTKTVAPKPLQLESEEKVINLIEDKSLPDVDNNKPPPVRKTARLRRREAIRKQHLLSHQASTKDSNETILANPSIVQRSLPDFYQLKAGVGLEQKKREGATENDEEEWSESTDVDDTVVTLDTTELENVLNYPFDPDQSSNETFEQIERYCNKNFDSDDVTYFDLDSPLNLRREVNKIQQFTTEPSNLIMQKLFSPLKPPSIMQQQIEPDSKQPNKPESGAILKRKLDELQTEIRLFQIENEALVKSRAEFESGVEDLKKQAEEFQKLKNQELADIEKYRKNEREQLIRDYQMFEEYVNTTKKSLPSKEDTETIRELKKELKQVRAEAKFKEKHLIFNNDRLRTKNTQLKAQLKSLEERNTNLERESEKLKASRRRMEIVDNSTSSKKVETVDLPITPRHFTPSPPTPITPRHRTTRKTICNRISTRCLSPAEGDVRTTLPSVADYVKSSGCNTQSDGVGTAKFNKEQVERRFTDVGSRHAPLHGGYQITRPDGTCVRVGPSCQRQIHTNDFQRFEYEDGTSKTIYPDGRQEIKYPSGHLRMEDPNGRVVFDTSIDQI